MPLLPEYFFHEETLPASIVTIEAGNVSSWKKYLGSKGLSLGIDRFGESAPYKKVYDHLNLSVEKIVTSIQNALRK